MVQRWQRFQLHTHPPPPRKSYDDYMRDIVLQPREVNGYAQFPFVHEAVMFSFGFRVRVLAYRNVVASLTCTVT